MFGEKQYKIVWTIYIISLVSAFIYVIGYFIIGYRPMKLNIESSVAYIISVFWLSSGFWINGYNKGYRNCTKDLYKMKSD